MKKIKRIIAITMVLFMVISLANFSYGVNAFDKISENTIIINDTQFEYQGDGGEYGKWGTDENQSTLYNGDSHWTNLKGTPKGDTVYYEFTFTGSKVALYGNKESKFGKVKVFIDDIEKGVFDGYSPEKIFQQKLWESDKLTNDTHTLKAVLLDEKNPASGGYNTLVDFAKIYVDVETINEFTLEEGQKFTLPMSSSLDSFEWSSKDDKIAAVNDGVVTAISTGETSVVAKNKQTGISEKFLITVIPTLNGADLGDSYYSEVVVNDTVKGSGELQFDYHGVWGVDQEIEGLYQDDAHWSDVSNWNDNPRNHYYTFRFTGRKIDIYGSLQPKLGIYDVYIDNIFMGKIDAYGNPQQKQHLYYSSPVLDEKQHELKVVMTGEKNPHSKGPSGFVDFVKVTRSTQKIYPVEVSLDKNNKIWEEDTKVVPEVTFLPENTNQRSITWEVDEEMIKVNEDGSLTPLKCGETTVVAIAKGKGSSSIKSKPLDINIVKGSSLGKVDFISKNRRVSADLYDEYAKHINKESSMTLWQNDAGNNAAILLTKDEAVKAQISVTDFTNELGDTLSKENIEANFQKYVSTYEGSNWIPTNPRPFYPPEPPKGNRVDAPDVIFGNEMDIPAHCAQPIWIKVNAPKGTRPGVYEGTIVITLNENERIELKQYVEVLEVALETESDYYLNLWQYPYSSSEYYKVEPFSQEHLAIVKNQMKPYIEAGGKTGTASIVEEPWYHQTYCDYPSMVKWYKNNGKWEFDYTDFDKWVSFLLNEIKVSYVECYSIVPWENRLQYTEDGEVKVIKSAPGTPEWTDAWQHFLKDFTKHLDQKGWFDNIIIAMDERPMQQMEAALGLIESIPNEDGHTLKVGGAVGSYNKDIWDRLFTVTPHVGNIHEGNIPLEKIRQLSDERREEGKLTSLYTMINDYPGMFSLSDPAEAAWTIWFTESCNTDGFLRWAYNAWSENPLEDNAHPYFEAGDMFFIYPGDYAGENTKVRTSPRFEMMSEAIKDVRKLRQMRESSDTMNEKVTKLIDSVQSFYGEGYNNGIGSAGFITATDKTKASLAAEVDRLHDETLKLSREYEASLVKKADYSELDKQVEAAKKVDRQLYTEESLAVLDKAIDDIVYDLTSANQDKVDLMAKNIETAIKELKEKEVIDKSDLLATIAKKPAKSEESYTIESWQLYQEALTKAKEIANREDVTQVEIDKANANLINAMNALIEKSDALYPDSNENESSTDTDTSNKVEKPVDLDKNDNNTESPETGDASNTSLLLLSMGLCVSGVLFQIIKGRKEQENI